MENFYLILSGLIVLLLLNTGNAMAMVPAAPNLSNLSQVRGVNVQDYVLLDREGSWPPLMVTPPSLDTRMAEISAKAFNVIRVPFYWEAYIKNPTAFLNEAASVAAAAQKYNLGVVFCMCQWNTGGQYFGSFGEGGGFPREATYPYLTQSGFWSAYYSNTVTINGVAIWDAHANMMMALIHKVDSYSSVIGYEPLNEPYIWYTWQYAKLGHLQTFIDSKMRTITSKPIWFDKVEPVGYIPGVGYPTMPGVGYVDMALDPLTVPLVSNIVFAPHFYDKTTTFDIDLLLNGYLALAMVWKVPYLIGEWGVTTQEGTLADAAAFHSYYIGFVRWGYDPLDQYSLMSINYNPTANMQYVMTAMAKYP